MLFQKIEFKEVRNPNNLHLPHFLNGLSEGYEDGLLVVWNQVKQYSST